MAAVHLYKWPWLEVNILCQAEAAWELCPVSAVVLRSVAVGNSKCDYFCNSGNLKCRNFPDVVNFLQLLATTRTWSSFSLTMAIQWTILL